MGIKLKWTDPNLSEEGTRIYRSDSPIDPNNLPPPVGTVGPNVTEWEDTEDLPPGLYYYRVGAFAAAQERVSEEITVDNTAPPNPSLGFRFRSQGAFVESSSNSINVPLPQGPVGDFLVLGVLIRGNTFDPPAGWDQVVITDPPGTPYSETSNQRMALLTRLADGTEPPNLPLTQADTPSQATDRIQAQCLRFIPEGDQIVLIGTGKQLAGPGPSGDDDNNLISLQLIPAVPFDTLAVALVGWSLNAASTNYTAEYPPNYQIATPSPRQQFRFLLAWALTGEPLGAGGDFSLTPAYVGTGNQYSFACQAVFGTSRS